MKMLYKYPHNKLSLTIKITAENAWRSRKDPEFEIADTGIFDEDRYFDCEIEYAKADQDHICMQISVTNRGPESATLSIIPTLWFRNTWSWGYPEGPMGETPQKPTMRKITVEGKEVIEAFNPNIGTYYLSSEDSKELLFTENETNTERHSGLGMPESTYAKDAFHRYLIDGEKEAVNPKCEGTKAALLCERSLASGESTTIKLQLRVDAPCLDFALFDETVAQRKSDCDEFYNSIQEENLSDEEALVQRQAYAGLLWSKQLYYYDIEQWLEGDPTGPKAPKERVRNADWVHLTNFDIISMPDTWEFPWYAAWDLAFHCIPLALIDADFAKRQLELMTREWYLHPNGQLPAYEWSFSDVNPPVHAWAAWRVYKVDARINGKHDLQFLEGIFHKMLLNFTWWVNRKDTDGRNVFQGGFLGLDNIGVFDRSAPLPMGGHIDQADATSWMASYCLTMMRISLELATENPVYQDSASKFLEHFLRVAHAMTEIGGSSLWNEEDSFFYDAMHLPDGTFTPLKVRSLVGLLPIIAAETIEPGMLKAMPDFRRRLDWFIKNRPHLAGNIARIDVEGVGHRRIIALVSEERLRSIFGYMFDENEFLSPYGIRSVSKFHDENPYSIFCNGEEHSIQYEPGESSNHMFGGNSNWRGPVWMPINFLLIEALQKLHHYYGENFMVEYPTGSGNKMNLEQIAKDLSERVCKIFLKDEKGKRAFYGDSKLFSDSEHFSDLILFNEYFHGDDGSGLGASHQTGWTALCAKLMQQVASTRS